MRAYCCDRLTDGEVTRTLAEEAARERGATARVLALIAEADTRRLYLPAGHASMYLYCVHELGYSEDAAYKRIQAARAARRFPALFTAVAAGRLHLSGVTLLAPHLTEGNADDLIGAAGRKTKAEIEALLAQRFPRPELLAMVETLPACQSDGQLAPGQVGCAESGPAEGDGNGLAPGQVGSDARKSAGIGASQLAPGQVGAPRLRVQPIAPERFALHLTISRATHEKLRQAQNLLGHRLPSGDLASVLDLALDALVEKLEKRRFAKTDKPRPRRRRTRTNPRHIPAAVKRAVWERDDGRCTFVGGNGRRCNARKFLEFDHIEPVARGGESTVAGLRLRCRAHNHYEAEQVFGADFMAAKRKGARAAKARAPRGHATPGSRVPEQRADATQSPGEDAASGHRGDVMAALRSLGFRAGEVRRATEFSAAIPEATVEERVRAALRFLGPRCGARTPGGNVSYSNHATSGA